VRNEVNVVAGPKAIWLWNTPVAVDVEDTVGVEAVHSRILLIENLERMGRMLAMYLLSAGYELASVVSPDAVEERLLVNPPDLIIFNTGLDAAEKSLFINRWRQTAPTIKVLEISPNPLIVRPSIRPAEVGAPDLYLDIPFKLDELGQAIETCLGQSAQEIPQT